MKRLAQLAGGRLHVKRALGAARDLKELEGQFRAAFLRFDWPAARRLAERIQAIHPIPPMTAEQQRALVEKVRRLVAEAKVRTAAERTTGQEGLGREHNG